MVFKLPPWANVIKYFAVVIYFHFMIITEVTGFYNTEGQQYHGMAVNCYGKKFYNIGPRGLYYKTFYGSNCCRIVIS
jgi:hypothetical protein